MGGVKLEPKFPFHWVFTGEPINEEWIFYNGIRIKTQRRLGLCMGDDNDDYDDDDDVGDDDD